MGSLLEFLCVLSALTATGFSLTCKLCSGVDFSCTGTTMLCPADHACGGIRTASIAYGVTVHEIHAVACVLNDQCNTNGSISGPASNVKIGTSCCYTDNCTPPALKLPADSSQPNGLTCQSCLSATSDWCYTGETMRCNGNENMCILQRTNTYAPPKQSVAIRGCATKSYCSLGSKSTTDIKVAITCSNGNFGLRSSPLFSFIVAIALTKVFFS